MTTRTEPHPAPVSSGARRGRRRRRVGVVGGLVVVAITALVGLRADDRDAPPALLDDLAPGTVAYVSHLDAVGADLDRERSRVAEAAGAPSAHRLLELAEVLEVAGQRYAAAPAPAWIRADVEAHLAALDAERAALVEAHDAVRSGDDARAALARVLTARDHADNLAAALRGTAMLHPAGR